MKSKIQIANILSVLVILAMLIAPVSSVSFAAPAEKATTPPEADGLPASTNETANASSDIYLIRLADAPLASYQGSISGLEATSPLATGVRKLDANSPASLAYRQYLSEKHAQFVSAMEQAFGHPMEVAYEYFAANNGLAVHLSPAEAKMVSSLPGVVFVQPDRQLELHTDYGPAWIGAPGIWDGSATGGAATMGEGVIVGVIDTGINPANPSFAEVGPIDGYVHINPYGSGNYTPGSYCDLVDPTFCNDKLIGAWGYPANGNDPTDYDGHGSHTASTAAGNIVTATLTAPTTSYDAVISGVAPHANIIAYGACCADSDLAAAYDQIIFDGVDVVNHSIGATGCVSSDPWTDFIEVAFLEARNAGIFVANSAGNCGPGSTTLGSPAEAPWLTAVGASTHNRKMISSLINMAGGTPPPDMDGVGINAGYGPDTIVHASAFGDGQCLNPFPAGTWTNGEIVMCDRGTIARVQKGANVLAGGAAGFVLGNTNAQGEGIVADPHFLPAVHIGDINADLVRAWLGAPPANAPVGGLTATITGLVLDLDASNGDVMAGFSSRGPGQAISVLKPDVTAPGQDIFAAYGAGNVIEWNIISGTSMASPHVAGSAALLIALHPTWTPAEVQSALMTTAWDTMLKEDGVTPTDLFDMGSGRVDLGPAAMAGLVMDETYANYLAADPSIGGDPRTLNTPSMEDWDCVGTCVFTRTVSSPLANDVNWDVTVEVTGGLTMTVTPSNFTLAGGASQELVVTVDASGAALGAWHFAKINLTPSQPVVTVAAPAYTAPAFKGPLPEGAVDMASDADANAPRVASPLTDYRTPDAVLYDNGPLVNCAGCGAGGADESQLQDNTIGLTIYGFGHSLPTGNRMADQFTITDPDGWDVDDIVFYAYQTGSTTASTINHVNLRIWDGPPNAGGTIIWGDTTTNVLTGSVWSNIYRTLLSAPGATNRPIMASTAGLGGLHLAPGTYWLDWQTGGTLASGPWAPPITINGQAVTGDGLQYIAATTSWGAALDTTNAQGFPFTVLGTVTPPPQTTFCSTPNLAIPDNIPAGVSDSIVIADASNIIDANLTLTATHTWVGDLIFTLSHDDTATSVVTFNLPNNGGGGCSGNDLTGIVLDDDGEGAPGTSVQTTCTSGANPTPAYVTGGYYTPNSPLSAFDGETHTGTWTLSVSDNAAIDTGILAEWCVTFEYSTPFMLPAPAHLPVAVFSSSPVPPTIDVAPSSLSNTQLPDVQVILPLTISNLGDEDLNWTIDEAATPNVLYSTVTLPSAPAGTVTIGDGPFGLTSSGAPAGSATHALNVPAGLTTITHSATQNVVSGNSIACTYGAGLPHADNSYIRSFTLADFGITSPLDVTEVSFGVELATGAGGDQPVTVNLYTWDTSDPFTFANFTLVGTSSVDVPDQTLSIYTVPVTGTISAGGTLVVEVFTPDGQTEVNRFFVGSNADGQTAPSYLASAPCGIAEPLDIAAIGFPNMHIVMNVTGDIVPAANVCATPSDILWASVNPISGTTTGGADSVVDVTLDSTGLVTGTYTGTLCVNSNDLVTPLVTVPLTLIVGVGGAPTIVTPDALESTQGANQVVTSTLTISNTGTSDLNWDIFEDADAPLSATGLWADNFDSYPTGQNLHGVGGWKGWDNSPAATAFTSAAQALSAPNSVDIAGGSDLVQEYVVATSGQWTYTAMQYVPSTMTGLSYFILLNTYADGGPNNWSVQVNFDASANTVINDGASGGTLTLVEDQWVEIRVEIDLDADTQDFYYNNQLLYAGTWTDEQGAGNGALNIGAVDLYANGATSVFYDDISLTTPLIACDFSGDYPWLSVSPTSGTTAGGTADDVTATFDSTGLSTGVYTGTLCVGSNDLTNPMVTVPLTLTVVDVNADLSITKSALAEVTVGDTFTYTLEVANAGPATALTASLTDTLPAGVTFVSGAGCFESGGTVWCVLGDIASGDSASATIVVTADVVGTVTNSVSVTSASPDPNTSNNSDSVDTEVVAASQVDADLSITKSAPDQVIVGDTFTYTLEVTNDGPNTALSTTVSDTLPAGVTFVSATVGCTEAGGVVTCDLGDLASGGTETIEIVVTADVVGAASNTASVTSASPDPDTSNNSDSALTDVDEVPEEEFWIYLPIIVNDD